MLRLTDDMYDKQRLLLYHPDSNRMMFTSVNKLGHRVPNTYFKPDKPWGEFFKSSGSQSKRSRLYRIE